MPDLGRWTVLDKMAEMYGEESGYVYAGNSPIGVTDIGGYFKIDAEFARQYPVLAKMIKYYLPMLSDNPTVRSGFKAVTGFSDKEFDEMVAFGSGPWITPTQPEKANWMDQNNPAYKGDSNFDPKNHPDDLFLSQASIERLEEIMSNAIVNRDGSGVAGEMFYLSLMIMHKAAHYGVFHHFGLDESKRREYLREQGAEWERLTFRQFSYTNGSSGMDRDDVNNYFRNIIRLENGRGMSASYSGWFNTWVFTNAPGVQGQKRQRSYIILINLSRTVTKSIFNFYENIICRSQDPGSCFAAPSIDFLRRSI